MMFRRPLVDPSVREGLIAAHTESLGRKPGRILAAAQGPSGWCALMPACLAHEVSGEWRFVPWHEIEQGSWNDQNRELRWERAGGQRGSFVLDAPGRVPEVFKERVEASIVLHRQVPIDGTREGGVVTARRDLGDRDAPLQWRIRRGRGTDDSRDNRAVLEEAMAELRSSFDI